MSDGGKGSSPRPFEVEHDEYVKNWDRIFGKKQSKPVDEEDKPVVEYKDEKREQLP